MKKAILKPILFVVFSAIVIIAIALFLIFYPAKGNDDSAYATKITLANKDTIVMNIYEEITLKDNFVQVTPSQKLDSVTVSVKPVSDKNVNGLTVINNKIKAYLTGSYTVKFSVEGKINTLSTSVRVTVRDDNAKIDVSRSNFVSSSEYDLSEAFVIADNNYAYEIDNTEILEISNNKLITKNVGQTRIHFYYDSEFYTSDYSFLLNVDQKPVESDYEFVYRIRHDAESITILYQLKYNKDDYVYQYAEISYSNETAVKEILNSSGMLVLKPLDNDGSVTITFVFHDRELTITKTIDLNLANI